MKPSITHKVLHPRHLLLYDWENVFTGVIHCVGKDIFLVQCANLNHHGICNEGHVFALPGYVKGTVNVYESIRCHEYIEDWSGASALSSVSHERGPYFLVKWGHDPYDLLLQTIIGLRQNFDCPNGPSGQNSIFPAVVMSVSISITSIFHSHSDLSMGSFFCSILDVTNPVLIGPAQQCVCNAFSYDIFGDHLQTCQTKSAVSQVHDWVVYKLGTLIGSVGHRVKIHKIHLQRTRNVVTSRSKTSLSKNLRTKTSLSKNLKLKITVYLLLVH